MLRMQDVLRTTLAKSLAGFAPVDRLSAAWPVVAGHAIGERSTVTDYDGATVTISADGQAWYRQLTSMAAQLRSDLAYVSRLPVTDILFVLTGEDETARNRASAPGQI